MSSGIKSFVSEKQLEEKRQKIQEEWDRVRKPEDPVEAPVVEVQDGRCLFERLQEQKDKKQEEFEEKLKFKNHFRGIDEDESNFLVEVNRRTNEWEKQKRDEEARELEEFRNAVVESRELPAVDPNIVPEIQRENPETTSKKTSNTKKNKQHNILKNAVKRKVQPVQSKNKNNEEKESTSNPPKLPRTDSTRVSNGVVVYPTATKCIGILPGLSAYNGDSGGTDDSSSDESDLTCNLLSQIVSKAQYE